MLRSKALLQALAVRFKDRSWLSDQGKIELTGLRGGKFQGFKVKEEPKALDSMGGVLWTHNFVTVSAENGASTEYVTPATLLGTPHSLPLSF